MIDLNTIPLAACLISTYRRRVEEYNHAFEEEFAPRHWHELIDACISDRPEGSSFVINVCAGGQGYEAQRVPVADAGGQWLCVFRRQTPSTKQGEMPEALPVSSFGNIGFREESEIPGIALSKSLEIVRLNTAARRLLTSIGAPMAGTLSPQIAGPAALYLLERLPPGEELQYSAKIGFGYYEIRLRRHQPSLANVYAIVRMRELTNKVRVYKRLQECNYLYKTVFQNVRIGLFQTTPEGKLITANPAMAKTLGYSSPAQLMREVPNMGDLYVYPARRKAIISHIERHGFVTDVESDVRRRDGSIARISGTTVGMKDSKGKLIMLQGTILDTRQYGKRQKVLEILKNTLLKISDSIIITDFEHEVIYVNEAFTRLYGYDLPELRETFAGSDGAQQRAGQIAASNSLIDVEKDRKKTIGAQVEASGSYSGEQVNITKSGHEIVVSVASSIIQDEFGAPLAYITISRDITRQHQAEQNLRNAKKRAEEADQLKANILSNMSHELRTPLTGIIGFASILKDSLAGQDEELLYFIDNIKQSGERLLETLNTILMVSDIDSQRVRYNFRNVPLRRVVEDSITRHKAQSGGAHLDVELHEDEPGMLAYADYDLLRQAFEKVYKNALKFTEEGSVSIRLGRQSENKVFIRVSDTGVGIPEENLQSIFSPFTQVSSGIARKYQGTGLGLYVCKSYMKMLHGNITVESEKGVGSVFTLYLPAGKTMPDTHA
ncbi:MAG: PAS domain-containing sensor histidine kinase [Cyclonatronaceae bacterium]